MGIVEFLKARLDEDEAAAQRSKADNATNPNLRIPAGWVNCVADRVLREVEAKRAIIGRHPEILSICQSDGEAFPCRTLEALVDIYADHRDNDPAWR